MKIRKEYILLIVVILALSFYLFLRKQDRTHYKVPRLPPITQSDMSKIEISKRGVAITLRKRDNTWRIVPQDYPADEGKVENMLDTIEKLSLTAMVSESKSYSRYDLEGDKKLTVKAWTGDMLKRDFTIGKVAPSYRHTFVQVGGDHRVYHAQGNFRGIFDQTIDSIRDKTVLSFDKAEIQEIRIAKDQQSTVFGRKRVPVEIKLEQEAEASSPPASETKTLWESAEGKKADEAKLNQLLATLSNLRCEKYVDDRRKDDFINPIFTVQLKGAQDYTLSVFEKMDKNAKGYPAISSESDYPFLLGASQTNTIMKGPAELLAKPLEQEGGKGEKEIH